MRALRRLIVRLLRITQADIPPSGANANLPNFLRRQAD